MGFLDWMKNKFNIPEEGYFEGNELEDMEYEDGYKNESGSYSRKEAPPAQPPRESNSPLKVVEMPAERKTPIFFKRLNSNDKKSVCAVAQIVNSKSNVVLNLETCPDNDAIRILDFLSGVAYANQGKINRVAGRAYTITTKDSPVEGDLLDSIRNEVNSGIYSE